MDFPVQKIAALALTEGANLSSVSHPLVIEAPVEAKAMADALEQEALRLSPRRILRVDTDPDAILTRLKDGKGAPPPGRQQKEARELLAGVAARVRVVAPRPDLLDGVPVKELLRLHDTVAADVNEAVTALSRRQPVDMSIPYPTEAWATRVYPGLGSKDALDRLSHALARSFLLHLDDPGEAWKRRIWFKDRVIGEIRRLRLTTLALKGRRTELEIALEPSGDWLGKTRYAFYGLGFQTAFPVGGTSAQVARPGSHGDVHINRPLTLAGRRVSGLDLTIRDGLVTVENAAEGGEILEAFLRDSPATRQLAAVSLPVSGHFSAPGNDVFCNPMMDATTACGLTLTDPETADALRFDLFFDDDLTIEGTDENGSVHELDSLLSSPEALKARTKEMGILGYEDCRVGDLDNKLRDGLTLIENGRIEDGIAALVETESLARECFRQFRISAADWESRYQQMDRLKIAEAARNAIERAQGDTD